jgi:CheY-like chemotaxis protein
MIDGEHTVKSVQLAMEFQEPETVETEQTATRRQRFWTAAPRILVVDDERLIRELLAEFLQDQGFECVTSASGEEALERLDKEEFALLVTDMSMPGMSGLDLLGCVSEKFPEMAVVVITAVYEIGTAVDSMKLGAYDYCRPMLSVWPREWDSRGIGWLMSPAGPCCTTLARSASPIPYC